jgi:hypothetical protein
VVFTMVLNRSHMTSKENMHTHHTFYTFFKPTEAVTHFIQGSDGHSSSNVEGEGNNLLSP